MDASTHWNQTRYPHQEPHSEESNRGGLQQYVSSSYRDDTRMLEYRDGIRRDPFCQTPANTEPWVPAVVDFYVQHHTPRIPEIDGSDPSQRTLLRYLRISTNNAVLFNAIMAFTSVDFVAKQPTVVQPELALFLKGRALQTINSALSDPVHRSSDPIIAAVVIMAGLESIYQDLESSKAHMRGARRMIQLRGGLKALGCEGMFAKMFLYVDLAQSLVTHQRFFDDIEEATETDEERRLPASKVETEIDVPGSTILVGFLPRPRGYCTIVIDSDLWNNIREIYRTIAEVSRRPESQRKQMDLTVFRTTLRALASPLSLYGWSKKQDQHNDLNATISFLLTAALRSILAQLWRFLEPPETSELPASHPPVPMVEECVRCIASTSDFGDEVIWSLAVMLSDKGWGLRERSTVMDTLRSSCEASKIFGWKKLLAVLRRYIYFAAMQKTAMMELWHHLSRS